MKATLYCLIRRHRGCCGWLNARDSSNGKLRLVQCACTCHGVHA